METSHLYGNKKILGHLADKYKGRSAAEGVKVKEDIFLNRDILFELYRRMLLIRYFEEKIEFGFSRDQIHGTVHLCIGQEAIPVGVCAHLTDKDYVVGTHRGHGHALSKGLDPGRLMAEIMGKASGYCKGRGGTQHLACIEKGFLGTNGITAGGIPLATGAALAIKYKREKNISVCFFGDGATNQGTFHESLNIASIWNLPIMYVCENNLYAMSAPIKNMLRNVTIADRAKAYGMRGIRVNGMNVLEVYKTAKQIIAEIRAGAGPVLLECETYRFRGHSRSDPRNYRTKEEEKEWEAKCPIRNLREEIVRKTLFDEQVLIELERKTKIEIEEAYSWALSADFPSREDTLGEVFYG